MSTPKKRKRILNPPTVRIPSPDEKLKPAPEAERTTRAPRVPETATEVSASSSVAVSRASLGFLFVFVFLLFLGTVATILLVSLHHDKLATLDQAEKRRIERIAALEAEIATLKEANESLREEVAEGVQRAENAAQVVADQMTTTQEMFDRVMERIPDGIGSFILQPDTPPPPPESSPFFSERTIQEDVDLLKKKITDGFGRLIRISPPDGP